MKEEYDVTFGGRVQGPMIEYRPYVKTHNLGGLEYAEPLIGVEVTCHGKTIALEPTNIDTLVRCLKKWGELPDGMSIEPEPWENKLPS